MRIPSMISRRLSSLALGVLALAGCHQDPTVVKVTVAAAADALTLTAEGGASSVPAGVVAGAGGGGAVQMLATGPINLGNAATIPAAPALPSSPATGTELTNALIGTTVVGNIFVSSTLQISGAANPAVIATNTGDVVILGSLIAQQSAGPTMNGITINAPAGTIYVFGAIQASGTAGVPDNPNGGAVTLNALRIVVTGSIVTSGETESVGAGGSGGAVMLNTTAAGGSSIFFTGGSIVTSGGSGTSSGGQGGAVTLQAADKLAVYAPITTSGGTANDVGTSPPGGPGGAVTLNGNGGVDVVATILTTGGSSTGNLNGALGGAGGAFTANSPAPYRIYGAILTTGGSATATAAGAGAVTGGSGGAINIGTGGTRVSSLEMGMGTYSTRGGLGGGGGGTGGAFTVDSTDGDIAVQASLIARGGDAAGPGNANGGNAGTISIRTDATAGNLANHVLSIPSFATLLDSSGGLPIGGTGGAGQAVTLQSGGDLTFGGRIVTSGGSDGISSVGGAAGPVALLLNAASTTPSGDLNVSGSITAEGGIPTSAAGGAGSTIDIKTVKAGSLGSVTCSATLSTVGGGNGGGNAGIITISAIVGNVSVSGSISAAGRSGATSPGNGANVVVSAGTSILSSASIVADGGSGTDSTSVINGGNAATVSFASTTNLGSINLSGTTISATGGAATSTGVGGTGGTVLMTTFGQPVTITGSISALGGASSGAGGTGGQVVVDSDHAASGSGGPITLTAGSVINVSGGSGTIGGLTLNNGGVAPANATGRTLCVIFDAEGGLGTQPNNPNAGIVQNLGSIVATGGSPAARGGDVWFDGRNSLGVVVTFADGGSQTLTGTAGNGAFFPN
jgi:hypothetical protein